MLDGLKREESDALKALTADDVAAMKSWSNDDAAHVEALSEAEIDGLLRELKARNATVQPFPYF